MTPDIEALARQAGLCLTGYGAVRCTTAELERFASIVRDQSLEEAAQACGRKVKRPAGWGGQWEGYGPSETAMSGAECAEAIQALKEDPDARRLTAVTVGGLMPATDGKPEEPQP